jgi:DNA polymerase III subunit delta
MDLVKNILKKWESRQFACIYWLEGEEDYYIDVLVDYAENKILTNEQASFNKDVFYGKDSSIQNIISACRQYPINTEKRLVIVKEAQHLPKLEDLKLYVENPVPSTILIVAHKEKKLLGTTSLAKTLTKKAEVVSTKKMYDNQLEAFAQDLVQKLGYSIHPQALSILVSNIGNQLSRLANEIEKLCINIKGGTQITAQHVETFIGVSKEYNSFAFQQAVGGKNLKSMLTMVDYFDANPKAAPIELILILLYGYFSKLYILHDFIGTDERNIAAQLKVNPYFVKDYLHSYKLYSAKGIDEALLLIGSYSRKNMGIGASNVKDAELLKELCVKLMLCK